jgi:hypothetical protein
LRQLLPSSVAGLVIIRTTVRLSFTVSQMGKGAGSSRTRSAFEVIGCVFSQGGVGQLSVWASLGHLRGVEEVPYSPMNASQGKMYRLRSASGLFDLWKTIKSIPQAGYAHIIPTADIVGKRDVTIIRSRGGDPPKDLSFSRTLQTWDKLGAPLASILGVFWYHAKLEKMKGRRRAHDYAAHMVVVWRSGKKALLDGEMRVPDLARGQIDIDSRDCIEGMWKDSLGFDKSYIDLMPGQFRKYFLKPQDMMPQTNAQLRELLRTGWRGSTSFDEGSQQMSRSPGRLAVSFATAVTGLPSRAPVEERDGDDDSRGLGLDGSTDGEKVSTLSGSSDDMIGEVIRQLRQDEHQQVPALVQSLQMRIEVLERNQDIMKEQVEDTRREVMEIHADGERTAACVHRLEKSILEHSSVLGAAMSEIKEIVAAGRPQIPPYPMWFPPFPQDMFRQYAELQRQQDGVPRISSSSADSYVRDTVQKDSND